MSDAVNQVKDNFDIAEYIGRTVKLKKTGQTFKGVCPFHQEKTPSFSVSPQRGFWYCFGCQRGGDIISFVMEKENLPFREALRVLADEAGVNIKKYDAKKTEIYSAIEDCLTKAHNFYRNELSKSKIAQNYLKQKRQLSPDLIEKFSLGYAPDNWHATTQHLKNASCTQKTLQQSGLTVASKKDNAQNTHYDRFRHRIMFPIYNHRSQLVGFSGRTLAQDKKTAKYLNSPETEVFKKGNLLFGMNNARKSISKQDYVVLVEGQLDVIALFGIGITNVVAPLGTALTNNQLKILRRYTERLIIFFDTDTAGMKATLKTIGMGLNLGFQIKVVPNPLTKDPDELIQKDPELCREAIRKSTPYFTYLFNQATERLDPNASDFPLKASAFILPYIKTISDPIQRERDLKNLSALIHISVPALEKELAQINPATNFDPATEEIKQISKISKTVTPSDRINKLWHELCALLLQSEIVDISPKQITKLIELTQSAHENLNWQPNPHKVGEFLLTYLKKDPVKFPQNIPADLSSTQKDTLDLLSVYDLGTMTTSADQIEYHIQRLSTEIRMLQVKNAISFTAQKSNLDTTKKQSVLKDLTDLLKYLHSNLNKYGKEKN